MKKIIIIGHSDQKKSFDNLLLFNKNELNLKFLNIDSYFSEPDLKSLLNINKVDKNIFIDRYVLGSFHPGLLPEEFNKSKQILFIQSLHNASIKICDHLININPSLVILEKNNYVGKFIGNFLDKNKILNGIFFPLRFDNRYMFFDKGIIKTPYIFNNNPKVNIFKNEVNYLKEHRTDNGIISYFKKRKYYLPTKDFRLNLLSRNIKSKLIGWILRLYAKNQFDKLVISPKKGIYFFLHHQPEVALEDCRPDWINQISKLEELRKYIPLEIPLYVRESPSMVYRRSLDDYSRINRLPNTFLVSTSTTTKNILNIADMIITVTGTVALEAVSSGVPSVIMYNTWFSKCPGITVINNPADISYLFSDKIKKIDKNDAKSYLKDLSKKIAVKGRPIFIGNHKETEQDFMDYIDAIKLILKNL